MKPLVKHVASGLPDAPKSNLEMIARLQPYLSAERYVTQIMKELGCPTRYVVPSSFDVEKKCRSRLPHGDFIYKVESPNQAAVAAAQIEALEAALRKFPTTEYITCAYEAVEGISRESIDADINRVAVAWLLDTRIKQPPNPEVYFESCVYHLLDEEFQPSVVAAACQRLQRSHRFLPEVSEIIEACNDIQRDYRLFTYSIKNMYECRSAAERRLDRLNLFLAGKIDSDLVDFVGNYGEEELIAF